MRTHHYAAALAMGTLACSGYSSGLKAAPIEILFVGNSFTFAKYAPVINYMAGFDSGPGAVAGPHVHDLQCLSAATCSTAENVAAVTPSANPAVTGISGLTNQLNFLNGAAGASAKFTEPGPFGGIPGIFLKLTQEAGLSYNVSIDAISSTTLNGTWANATNLPVITQAKWDRVVLQEQSFTPLPTTITVNGGSVTTRGNPANFNLGISKIVNSLNTNDVAAGRSNAKVTLYETQPLASYGYTSANPAAPIFGSSTGIVGTTNNNPYVGAAQPVQQMATDLHNSFVSAAATANALGKNPVDTALAGDAWITAMNNGYAMINPYLTTNPANQVDLWDSNPLDACCTTPIGYHPSKYGAYLSAAVLFEQITGVDPRFGLGELAAQDLGIDPAIAVALQNAAALTVAAGGATVPEPASLSLLACGAAMIGLLRGRGKRRSPAPD